MSSLKLDITIPILNEEETLEVKIETLIHFLKELPNRPLDWSIIVADNGSQDDSPEIMRKLCGKHTQLDYLRINQIGVGLALKTSWLQSESDIVGYMDLDLATSLEHLGEMMDIFLAGQADIVNGTRLHKDSKVTGRSWQRELASRVFNLLLKNYLDVHFTDGMCGFKFLWREVAVNLIDAGARNDGWFFSTELLYLAEKMNYRINEIPVIWTDYGESKVQIPKLAFKYLNGMYHIKKVVRQSDRFNN